MHEITTDSTLPKPALYAEVVAQTRALLEGERDAIANFANTDVTALSLAAGLELGGRLSAQGRRAGGRAVPGQTRVRYASRSAKVCAVRRPRAVRRSSSRTCTQFDGHIACDSASNSEIVVPLLRGNELIGVLDLDSPKFERFDAEDQAGLEQVVAELLKAL
jgi:GAF domain-containing protein